MSADERGTIAALDTARKTFHTKSVANGGRVVDTAGDSVLAIFKTAAGATAAALAIQNELQARADAVPEDRRLLFRVGLHLGDVVQKADGSVYGDGVNVAARLQSMAPPGGIVVSESVRLAVQGKAAASFEDLGQHALKNIAEPVRAHRVSVARAESDASGVRLQVARSDGRSRWLQRWHLWSVGWSVPLVLAAAAIAAALFVYHDLGKSPTPPKAAGIAGLPQTQLSILVLPFTNLTGDDAKAYIADALTTSITADLSRIRDAFVVPAANAFTYKLKAMTIEQIGKDAGVRFVLEGSVLASGQNLRVTAQLVDTKTSAQLWNETFQGDLYNLFALQDQVTTRIANSIGEHMVIVAARESETRKSAPQVVDLMLRALALGLRPQSIENFHEEERLYREVLALEPNNLSAMARLAATLAIHANWMDDSDPRKEKQMADARDLALKVRAIDPSIRDIEIPLQMYAVTHGDFEGAKRVAEARLAKDPKSPSAYISLAFFYRLMGEPARAIPLLIQALSLYPKGNDALFANLGGAYLELGDNDAAIEWLLKSVDANSHLPDPFWGLAMAYSNKGDRPNAERYVAEYKRLANELGLKGGIQSYAPIPGSPPAVVKYYNEHWLPEWQKAGLP